MVNNICNFRFYALDVADTLTSNYDPFPPGPSEMSPNPSPAAQELGLRTCGGDRERALPRGSSPRKCDTTSLAGLHSENQQRA